MVSQWQYAEFCAASSNATNYYPNYLFRQSWLLKRLKGLATEHYSLINLLTGSKDFPNQHDTTVILFFNEFGIY